jgi:hypothetical protein
MTTASPSPPRSAHRSGARAIVKQIHRGVLQICLRNLSNKDGDFMGFNTMSNGDLMEFINHKLPFHGIYMDLSNKHCDFMGYNQQTLDIVHI